MWICDIVIFIYNLIVFVVYKIGGIDKGYRILGCLCLGRVGGGEIF